MAQNKSSKLLLRSERNLVRDILLLLSNTLQLHFGERECEQKVFGNFNSFCFFLRIVYCQF